MSKFKQSQMYSLEIVRFNSKFKPSVEDSCAS